MMSTVFDLCISDIIIARDEWSGGFTLFITFTKEQQGRPQKNHNHQSQERDVGQKVELLVAEQNIHWDEGFVESN
jgi:hypothetical protein